MIGRPTLLASLASTQKRLGLFGSVAAQNFCFDVADLLVIHEECFNLFQYNGIQIAKILDL